MDALKEEIQLGSYRVDPKAVADAIMLRMQGHMTVSAGPVGLTGLPFRTSARTPRARSSCR